MIKRVALLLMAAPLLASCGLRGGLERPPPLFGDAKERYEAEQAAAKAAEAEAKAARKPEDTPRPPPPESGIAEAPVSAGPIIP